MDFKEGVLFMAEEHQSIDAFIKCMYHIYDTQVDSPEELDPEYHKGTFFYQTAQVLQYEFEDYKKNLAIASYQHAIKIFSDFEAFDILLSCYHEIANLYDILGDKNKAKYNCLQALSYILDGNIRNWEYEYVLNDQLGKIADDTNAYQTAIDLALRKGDDYKLLNSYLGLANTYINKEFITKAKEYYNKVLEGIPNDDEFYILKNKAYIGLGNIHLHYRELGKALIHFESALDYCPIDKNDPDFYDRVACLSNIATIYSEYVMEHTPTEYPDKLSLEASTYFFEALVYYQEALEHAKELYPTLFIDTLLKLLSHIQYVDVGASDEQIKKMLEKVISVPSKQLTGLEGNDLLEILFQGAIGMCGDNYDAKLEAYSLFISFYIYKIRDYQSPIILNSKMRKLAFENNKYGYLQIGLFYSGILSFYEGDFEKAYSFIKEYFEQESKIPRDKIFYDQFRINRYGLSEEVYDYMIRICIKLQKNKEAFQYLEDSKSQAFRELMVTSKVHRTSKMPHDFYNQEKKILSYIIPKMIQNNDEIKEDLVLQKFTQLQELYNNNSTSEYVSLKKGKRISLSELKALL